MLSYRSVHHSLSTQFIGKEMELSQVEHATMHNASNILTFYMGRNTPPRKDYITENSSLPWRNDSRLW